MVEDRAMEVIDIVLALRRGMNLSEAAANERAYAMLAVVKGRHPRLEITAVVVENQMTIVCLENGTQVKFDPSLPVPVWKYAEGTHGVNPKHLIFRSIDRIEGLRFKIAWAKTEAEKQEARNAIAAILKQNRASTVEELQDRVFNAASAERGELGD